MILPRLLVSTFSWAAVTGVATAVSWSGISLVTDEVTREHPALSPAELAAPTPPPTAASPPASAPAAPDTTATPPPTTVPPTAPPAAPSPPTAPPVTVAPAVPVTAARVRPAAPVTATYLTRGGVVTVSCAGDAISLTGARPADGYRLVVRRTGPEEVAVEFAGVATSYRVLAVCVNGAPVRLPFDGDRRRRDGPGDPYRDGDPDGFRR